MIEIKDLSKSYGDLKVLRGIDLKINDNEVVTFIGPSGTGKSTLLRCINFLEIPDEGNMKINNVHIDFKNATKDDIQRVRNESCMVFQNYNLFNNKTVLENVTEGLIIVKKKSISEAENIAKKYLEMVDMSDKLLEYPSRLSGGQKQRVGIARALAMDTNIILFDEPTSSLDPSLVNEVLNLIKRIVKETNKIIIIVTHEMEFAKEISDRIIFLYDGNIIANGTPKAVLENSNNNVIKNFIRK